MKKTQLVIVGCMLIISIRTFADFTIGVIPDTQNMAEDDVQAQKIVEQLQKEYRRFMASMPALEY